MSDLLTHIVPRFEEVNANLDVLSVQCFVGRGAVDGVMEEFAESDGVFSWNIVHAQVVERPLYVALHICGERPVASRVLCQHMMRLQDRW